MGAQSRGPDPRGGSEGPLKRKKRRKRRRKRRKKRKKKKEKMKKGKKKEKKSDWAFPSPPFILRSPRKKAKGGGGRREGHWGRGSPFLSPSLPEAFNHHNQKKILTRLFTTKRWLETITDKLNFLQRKTNEKINELRITKKKKPGHDGKMVILYYCADIFYRVQ